MKNILYLILILFLYSCTSVNEKPEITEPQLDSIVVAEEIYQIEEDLNVKSEPITTIYPEPPQSEPPQSQIKIVHNPLDFVTEGDIVYVVKDSMIVGEINIVNMTVSYGVDKTEIIAEIETFADESEIYSEKIRIAPVMRARLVDVTGENFTITPVTPEEQFLEYNTYTLWKWNVIPLKQGDYKLSLSVDIVIGDKGKTIQVYDDFIYVYSTDTFIDKAWNFLQEKWEWFLSTLIIPLFIFLYRIFFKKKEK
jgi:hypothetical protein